jgi:hypothetical protein
MFAIFFSHELHHLLQFAGLIAFLWLLLGLAEEVSAARHVPVQEAVTCSSIPHRN